MIGHLLKPATWVHHHHVNYATGDIARWSRLERSAVFRSSTTIACSPLHAERIAADFAGTRPTFLPYMKNEGALLPAPMHAQPVIGFIGLLRAIKGVPLLLSMRDVISRLGMRLVIWGKDTDNLFSDGVPMHVEWRGEYDPDNDLDDILASVSCLALPFNEGEGLPIVISEALSRGIPVATFPFSGIAHLHGLHPGLAIVEPTREALLEAVMRLVNLGAAVDFRSALRDAYHAALGNTACLQWWENTLVHAK